MSIGLQSPDLVLQKPAKVNFPGPLTLTLRWRSASSIICWRGLGLGSVGKTEGNGTGQREKQNAGRPRGSPGFSRESCRRSPSPWLAASTGRDPAEQGRAAHLRSCHGDAGESGEPGRESWPAQRTEGEKPGLRKNRIEKKRPACRGFAPSFCHSLNLISFLFLKREKNKNFQIELKV